MPKAPTVSRRILQPPRLFLDTAHLVNIFKVRHGQWVLPRYRRAYEVLSDCLLNQHFGVLCCEASPLEWVDGNATEQSACEIASILDSAKLRYFYESDQFVFLTEALNEIHRVDPAVTVPSLPCFQHMPSSGEMPIALGHLAQDVPDYFDPGDLTTTPSEIPKRIPVMTARTQAKHAWGFRHRRAAVFQERVDGFVAALQNDLDNAQLLAARSSNYLTDWMKRFLRIDRVLRAFNPSIDIDATLNSIVRTRCPAIDLFFRARTKRVRAGYAPKENEVDDWFFLPVVPYADLVLIDSNFREFIVQADRSLASRVFSDPDAAVDALRALVS